MRPAHLSSIAVAPIAVALGLVMFAASLAWQVPVTQASSGPLDAQSSELVRLINGARTAAGRSALNVDPVLASLARNGAIPCPDDASKTIAGRSQDFAAYGALSHDLRLCDASSYAVSGTLFVTTLQTHFGYGSVGEIDLVNGGYGNGAYLYTSGSWRTWTYSTTGHAMVGWASSGSHWSIVIGGYDRVGCGGWSSGSTYYYDCAFSSGGPNGVKAPPTASPFNLPLPTPLPRPTPPPAPAATQPPASTHAGPPSSGGGSTTTAPSAAPSGSPSASPTLGSTTWVSAVEARRLADASAAPVAAIQTDIVGAGSTDAQSTVLALMSLVLALMATFGAAVLGALSLIPAIRRRRRETLP
ncbi:MAG: hypothetical protein ACHQ01_07710 [Candidatus Limnocylindrales bacterium]